MEQPNICLMTDSYKFGHYKDYPKGTEYVYSYMESRGGIAPTTLFFGLQYYLKQYLAGVVVTQEMIDEAQEIVDAHMGPGVFNREGWEYILNSHGGKLPVEICAVPEGTNVEVSNVLFTITNTDPKCFWITNYLETLLMKVWYPITVASISQEIKKVITEYLVKTGDPLLVDFKLHDFGYRGVSSEESAAIGASAHLINFKGGDTVAGIKLLRKNYDTTAMPAFSIFATEHSIICAFGPNGEKEAYENFLRNHPSGIIACVSDTYDIQNACRNLWGTELRDMVNSRAGTLVVRPDSGDPPTIVLQVLNILGEQFGFELNHKGYRVLNPHIRVIQGDGVNLHSIREILRVMEANGWSADNIAFGMGGALLQQMNRDTFKFAMKASFVQIRTEDGALESREIFKRPTSDTGKASKAGQLALTYSPTQGFRTVKKSPHSKHFGDHLVPVFRNGEVLKTYTFDEVRENSNKTDYSQKLRMGALKEL